MSKAARSRTRPTRDHPWRFLGFVILVCLLIVTAPTAAGIGIGALTGSVEMALLACIATFGVLLIVLFVGGDRLDPYGSVARGGAGAWKRFRARNCRPCVRCGLPVWFAGYAPEHGRCMHERIREDIERRKARLIAEELHKLRES